jgi:hypothetical protein
MPSSTCTHVLQTPHSHTIGPLPITQPLAPMISSPFTANLHSLPVPIHKLAPLHVGRDRTSLLVSPKQPHSRSQPSLCHPHPTSQHTSKPPTYVLIYYEAYRPKPNLRILRRFLVPPSKAEPPEDSGPSPRQDPSAMISPAAKWHHRATR